MTGINQRPRTTPQTSRWYSRGYLPAVLLSTTAEFRTLGDYLTITQAFLDSEKSAFDQHLEELLAATGLVDDRQVDSFYEAHEEDLDRFHVGFPSLLLGSVLVAACSRLETGLTDICKTLETEGKALVSMRWQETDDRKPGRQRAAEFLKANFAIVISAHGRWATVCDHYRVRDCVVHAGGDISLMREEHQRELRGALARLADSGITEISERLSLERRYVAQALDDLSSLWAALENALEENADVGPRFWP